MDQALRDVYQAHHGRKALSILMKRFGYPKYTIIDRATFLGATTVRKKEPPWSKAELEILQEYAWMVPDRLRLRLKADGFTRTSTAIAIQKKRLAVSKTVDGTSATGLATLLGIDPSTVVRWIEKRWLRGLRSGTTGDNHDRWYVSTGAFRAFLLEHYEAVDLGKAERAGSKLWLLELLTNGAIGQNVEADNTGDADGPGLDDEAEHEGARKTLVEAVVGQVAGLAAARSLPMKALARKVGLSERQLTAALSNGTGLSVNLVASLAVALGAEVELALVDATKARRCA